MDIEENKIRSKTRYFVIRQLDGFNEFQNDDNLLDMGIVTDDFVLSLKQFIENEFTITISSDDLNNNNLSITSIGEFIRQKKKIKVKKDLISEIMMCFANIMGTHVFPLEVDFLDKLPYWNVELEADFKEQLVERFNIDIDLSQLNPLTFDKIADAIIETVILQEKEVIAKGTGKKTKNIQHHHYLMVF